MTRSPVRGMSVAMCAVVAMLAACNDVTRPGAATHMDSLSTLSILPLGDSVALDARHEVRDDTLHTRVSMRNLTTRRVHLEWGDCALRTLLFASPDTAGPVRFDSFAPRGPILRGCKDYRMVLELEPGADHTPEEFTESLSVRDIAGDSLAAGSYDVSTRVLLLRTREHTGEDRWFTLPSVRVMLR